ncbi:EH signature domain-containing protein [Verrucomicrobia bacterium]|nr:EH signature domain-containing protein [Verrucomicrobiota bacterium]
MKESVKLLDKLTSKLKGTGEGGMINAVDKLVSSLKAEGINSIDHRRWEHITNIPRREWTLLTMYRLYLADSDRGEWLREFDKEVACSILGNYGSLWKKGRRRQVSEFFFSRFDNIQCLELISKFLREAWEKGADNEKLDSAKVWYENRKIIFHADGPANIAKKWKYEEEETPDQLRERFCIPDGSEFSERLKIATYFYKLKSIRLFGREAKLFKMLEDEKNTLTLKGTKVGSEAVKIIIDRVINEANSQWVKGEDWAKQLVTLASDPRLKRGAIFYEWWGWANQQQLDVAVKALTKLNISEFIRLLKGSLNRNTAHQFVEREKFLLNLINNNYVIDARLVLRPSMELERGLKKSLSPLFANKGDKSFICLKCVDNVYLIEGTENFGLRGFIGEQNFPIKGFWEKTKGECEEHKLRCERRFCQIYQAHHVGWWVGDFLSQLRRTHILWDQADFLGKYGI